LRLATLYGTYLHQCLSRNICKRASKSVSPPPVSPPPVSSPVKIYIVFTQSGSSDCQFVPWKVFIKLLLSCFPAHKLRSPNNTYPHSDIEPPGSNKYQHLLCNLGNPALFSFCCCPEFAICPLPFFIFPLARKQNKICKRAPSAQNTSSLENSRR
jgi:hypothetical protein